MQKAAGREPLAQPPDQLVRQCAFGRADRARVPFFGFEIVDGNKGRLATHGKADVFEFQNPVDLLTQIVEGVPGIVGKGHGDARMLGDTGDLHVEGKVHFRRTRHAGDGGRVAVMRRAGQRNMAFAGKKSGGRVQSDPACAGQVNLHPGVKIGEVVIRARRSVQGLQIRFQLDQVAGDEAGGETEIAQDLYQHPTGIPARPLCVFKGFLRRLDAGLHADDVPHFVGDAGVEADDEIDRSRPVLRRGIKEGLEHGTDRFGLFVDLEIVTQLGRIVEGPVFRLFLDEEVERIVDRHIGDQIDLDLEFAHRLREHEPGEPIAVRVLLVIDEMTAGADFQRMGQDPRPAVRRRPQTDDLGPERDRAVVSVMGQMIDACAYRHGPSGLVLLRLESVPQNPATHHVFLGYRQVRPIIPAFRTQDMA